MFQCASSIENITTRKDGTLKLTVGTQELTSEQMAEVMKLHNKLGWFLFSENDIDKSDIPKENAPEFSGDKSPSQRLRSILYVYWDKCTDKTLTFNQYYDKFVQKKINEIKDKLPV